MFALAPRAAARPRELPAVTEDVAAVRTGGRFEDEAAGAITRERFGHVVQMVFDAPLRDAEHLGQLVGRQPGAGEEVDDALAGRAFGKRHEASMVRQATSPMQNVFAPPKKRLIGASRLCQHRGEPVAEGSP